MRQDYFDNYEGAKRTVQFMVALNLLCIAGCQPASPVSPAKLETVDLPRIDASTFESEVIKSAQPVLVEVAVDTGCPACEAMKPQVAEVARQVDRDVKILRLDHRTNREFAQQIGASVCPSYLIFHHGKLVEAIPGQSSADMLLDRLYSLLPQMNSSKPTGKDNQNTDKS